MNERHNLCETRLYRIWANMRSRCNHDANKDYPKYGGRGITVCDCWNHSFILFYNWALTNGYSDDLTIERVDNNLGYSPNNCKWATMKEQAANRRLMKNTVYLTIDGVTDTVKGWSERTGINRNTIHRRRNKLGLSGFDLIKPVGV